MYRALALVVLLLTLSIGGAASTRRPRNELLRVVTPVRKETATAHPFVNVSARFGSPAGMTVDTTTFRARMGGQDITDRFSPIIENGVVVGMRAPIGPPVLRVGRGANQLRLSIKGTDRGRPVKDVDRVRFRAVEGPNHPPIARVVGGHALLVPGTPTPFDGSQSYDPDGDPLDFTWDLGDGETSAEISPTHVYDVQPHDVTVRLTVSDSVDTASDSTVLFASPSIPPDRTPGQLAIEATQALEFGATALTTSGSRTITLRNTDLTPTSLVNVHLALEGSDFSVEPADVSLDAGESEEVTIHFAPATSGHRMAVLTVVGSSKTRGVVHLLSHGYGGDAPDNGPTLANTTLFYMNPLGRLQGILPDGGHFPVDNTVSSCLGQDGVTGTHDACVTSQDCGVPGEQCVTSQAQLLDPVDMCTAGDGHVYLVSDDVFTDFSTGDEHSVAVLDLALTSRGVRTGSKMLRHATTETGQVACDRMVGGNLYLAEVRGVTASARCFRDSREVLVALNRRNGNPDTLVQRIDAVEGFDECNDDIDPTTDLEVSPDGTTAYVTLDGGFDTGGLYRILPTAQWISPDIHDYFQLHPDGSIVYMSVSNTTNLGILSLYKINPEQASQGTIRLGDLTPCITFSVPNNGGFVQADPDGGSFAVAPAGDGFDATVIATFATRGGALQGQSVLSPRGTVAFSVPASGECSLLGLTSLEFMFFPRF